jgi:hypothetical protein
MRIIMTTLFCCIQSNILKVVHTADGIRFEVGQDQIPQQIHNHIDTGAAQLVQVLFLEETMPTLNIVVGVHVVVIL